MSGWKKEAIALCAGLIVALFLSYLFALLGEPTADWFWCGGLGVC